MGSIKYTPYGLVVTKKARFSGFTPRANFFTAENGEGADTLQDNAQTGIYLKKCSRTVT